MSYTDEKGKFAPGNPGRPKGAKDHKTRQWDALGEAICNEHTERFNTVLAKMEDEDFAEMYLKTLEYFKPKLSRQEVKSEVTNKHQPVQITAEEYRKMVEAENSSHT